MFFLLHEAKRRSVLRCIPLLDAVAISLLCCSSIFFVSLISIFLIQDSLCCADDSFNAVVAKNVAFGHGYASSAQFEGYQGFIDFDRFITTGPILVLPAALLIRIFGNQTWIPGIAAVVVCIALVAFIFFVHLRREQLWKACVYITVFGAICYAITAYHVEQWYTLLGELPAALLGISGVTLIAAESRRLSYLGSLIIGCAVLAKSVTVLMYLPALFWMLVWASRGRVLQNIFTIGLGNITAFLIPLSLFELWKLLSMGGANFLKSEAANVRWLLSSGFQNSSFENWGPRIAEYSSQFKAHFGFPIWMLIILGLVTWCTLWLSRNRLAWREATILFSASTLNLVWWLGFSPEWGVHRHALIGLILYAAGITTIVYTRLAFTGVLASGLLFAHLSMANGLQYPIQKARRDFSSSRILHLRQAAKILNSLESDRPFVSAWWAAYADLEYAISSSASFISYDRAPQAVLSRSFILAYNSRWTAFLSYTCIRSSQK